MASPPFTVSSIRISTGSRSAPTRSSGSWNAPRTQGLPYVYLGYWVPESRKMAYKARFRPSEILRAGQWVPLEEPHAALVPAGVPAGL